MKFKPLLTRLKNSQGFSLSEAVIGVSLIAVVAVLVARYGTQTSTSNRATRSRTCEAVAQGVIDAVKRRGVYKEIFNFAPLGANRSAGNLFSHAPLVADADLWGAANGDGANEFRINSVGGVEETRSGYVFIDGYMRSLMAIYNSNPGPGGFCDTWTAYPSITVGNLGLTTDLLWDTNADGRGDAAPPIMVQVRPYDTSTGGPLATPCPAVVRAFPPGIGGENVFNVTNPTPLTNLGGGQDSLNYDDITFTDAPRNAGNTDRSAAMQAYPASGVSGSNIGFAFNVRVQYTENGNNLSCEAEQRFQYHADQTVPTHPTVQIDYNNSVPIEDPNYVVGAGGLPPNRTLRIRVRAPNSEKGIQLYCRDRSQRLSHNLAGRGSECYVNGVQDSSYRAGAPEDAGRVVVGPQVWVPCDQVTACNVAGVAAKVSDDPPEYTIEYSMGQGQWGCDVVIDAFAIDAAGNRSDVGSNQLNRTAFMYDNLNTASVIRPPRCARADGNYGGNFGRETEFGWLCDPTDPDLPYWNDANYSSDADRNWTNNGYVAYDDGGNQIPNGYYTNKADGCCRDPAAPYVPGSGNIGPRGDCTPWATTNN